MKNRPKLLTWQCFFLLFIALSFPLQIMFLFGLAPWEFKAVAIKIAPLNWIVMGFALLSSVFAWRASRLLLFTIPLVAAAVLYNNWIVAVAALNFVPELAWGSAATGAILLCLPLLRQNIRNLLTTPSRRWWLTPTRHPVHVPVRLKLHLAQGSHEFLAMTYDLSEGGAFIPLEMMAPTIETGARDLPPTIGIGTQCYVSLPLRGLSRVTCRGEVVRYAGKQGQYPVGIGIRFLGLGWKARQALEEFLAYRMTLKHDNRLNAI